MLIHPDSSIHRSAVVEEGAILGPGCCVEAYARVKAGATIGNGCIIRSGAIVENGATLKDAIIVGYNASINPECIISSNVEIHPGAVLGKIPQGASATARAIKTGGATIIGAGSQIGPHAVIYQDVVLGEGCLVGEGASIREECRLGMRVLISRNVTLNYNVVIGDRVKIMDMSHITGNSVIEDDVFISTLVATTNDNQIGRQGYSEDRIAGPIIKRGAAIGASANILPGVRIGASAVVGASALVTKDVPPGAIVMGIPARITGYVGAQVSVRPAKSVPSDSQGAHEISVRGVKIYRQKVIEDLRGKLNVGEYPTGLPFMPKRYYVLYAVPTREVRGEHAHKTLHQFLACLAGECALIVDDGTHREEIVLNDPCVGVYRPPMIWGVQYKFSPDAVLLVLASESYNAADYIRDYDEFLSIIKESGRK